MGIVGKQLQHPSVLLKLCTFGRVFRRKAENVVYKSHPLKTEWFCPLQGAAGHGRVNLCLNRGGAPFIQRPKEPEKERDPDFASIKPLQLTAGQKIQN